MVSSNGGGSGSGSGGEVQSVVGSDGGLDLGTGRSEVRERYGSGGHGRGLGQDEDEVAARSGGRGGIRGGGRGGGGGGGGGGANHGFNSDAGFQLLFQVTATIIAQSSFALVSLNSSLLSTTKRFQFCVACNILGFGFCVTSLMLKYMKNQERAQNFALIGFLASGFGFIPLVAKLLPSHLIWVVALSCLTILLVSMWAYMPPELVRMIRERMRIAEVSRSIRLHLGLPATENSSG